MKKFDYRGRLIFTTAAGEKVSALLDAAALLPSRKRSIFRSREEYSKLPQEFTAAATTPSYLKTTFKNSRLFSLAIAWRF